MFETLHPFGFNNSQTKQIIQNIENQPGSFYFSKSHRLLIDRLHLVLEESKKQDDAFKITSLSDDFSCQAPNGKFVFKILSGQPSTFPTDKNIAIIDADKVKLPITLRHWRAGDVFHPFGMGGKRKKLQDLFTNEKLSRSEKEKIWVMESGEKICWVVGIRLDERFKVTTKTTSCLVVEFLPSTFAEQ